jgi:aminoglycoside phosphotransferase
MIQDPAVPRRDALLRPETMARVISERLRVPVERCERVYVKYRVGESLRAVYRYDGNYVAARTGKRGDIALFPFPHDRKLDLSAVERLDFSTRLVTWAAEQSATFECRDPSGRVVAYAKVQRDPARWPELDAVRVPRVLAARDGVLLLEAIAGHRLDTLGGDGLHALGAALAALHATRAGGAPRERRVSRAVLEKVDARFSRLDPARLATAAEAIARVRPDVAPAAQRLVTRLLSRIEDSYGEAVLIHGDANLRNALLQADGTVALLDLEDLSSGPAAADLGQVLAALIVNRTPHAAKALLAGYGNPPDAAQLRWHTAASLLARQALPAISRHRPPLLARLRELLDAGSTLVSPVEVAA